MKLRSLWILVVAAVAGAALMAMAAQAVPAPLPAPTDRSEPQQPPRPPGPPDGPQLERLVFDLDLTPAQIQQVKAISDQARGDSRAYQDQLGQARGNLRALVEAATFDESAVRSLATTEAKAQVELTVIRARTEAAVYQLLTPDQRAKLADLRKAPPPPPDGPIR